jgi:outer membrane protein OmpA-like peptidoglycan-associated protein
MDRWGIPLVGLVALATLCWYCIQHEPHLIEEDLLTRSSAALQAGNIPLEGLRIEEQTAILTGPEGSLIVSEDAQKRVAAVWGITDVVVKTTGAVAPPPKVILSPQASQLEADLTQYLRGKTIRFAPASDIILPDGKRILDSVAKILSGSAAIPVEISGYTDSDGDPKLNLDLSKRRAAAVKRYLMTQGIAAGRMTDMGYGAANPIADNTTPEGKARNRRIEFHAQTKPSSGAISNQ